MIAKILIDLTLGLVIIGIFASLILLWKDIKKQKMVDRLNKILYDKYHDRLK